MTDLTPEAPEEFTAFAVVDAATGGKVVVGMSDPGPEQVGAICRYVRADTIAALRAAPVAAGSIPGSMYGEFTPITVRSESLPLDAPAPVDPVAEAARIDAKDLYYLRAILRRLREFDAAIEEAIGDGADNISLLGNQAMADEIDWLTRALAQEARHEG